MSATAFHYRPGAATVAGRVIAWLELNAPYDGAKWVTTRHLAAALNIDPPSVVQSSMTSALNHGLALKREGESGLMEWQAGPDSQRSEDAQPAGKPTFRDGSANQRAYDLLVDAGIPIAQPNLAGMLGMVEEDLAQGIVFAVRLGHIRKEQKSDGRWWYSVGEQTAPEPGASNAERFAPVARVEPAPAAEVHEPMPVPEVHILPQSAMTPADLDRIAAELAPPSMLELIFDEPPAARHRRAVFTYDSSGRLALAKGDVVMVLDDEGGDDEVLRLAEFMGMVARAA